MTFLGSENKIALAYADGSLKLYVNYKQVASAAVRPTTTYGPLTIGKLGNAGFIGVIDELQLFDRALGPAEIQTSFTGPGVIAESVDK